MHLRPSDFFTTNPALDVPSKKNEASVVLSCCTNGDKKGEEETTVQKDPVSHLQGGGPEVDPEAVGASVRSG